MCFFTYHHANNTAMTASCGYLEHVDETCPLALAIGTAFMKYFSCSDSSNALSFGKKIWLGQYSKTVENIGLSTISVSDCVANTTDAFALRKNLSHSRIFCANCSLSKKTQHSSKIIKVGAPVKLYSIRLTRSISIFVLINKKAGFPAIKNKY